MLRRFVRILAARVLGPLARVGRLVLDEDARLAMTARAWQDMQPTPGLRAHEAPAILPAANPPLTGGGRRVGHLVVYEGGRQDCAASPGGPLGRPVGVARADHAPAPARAM